MKYWSILKLSTRGIEELEGKDIGDEYIKCRPWIVERLGKTAFLDRTAAIEAARKKAERIVVTARKSLARAEALAERLKENF